MLAITISGSQIIVGLAKYYSLNYRAKNSGNIITIYSSENPKDIIAESIYSNITINGLSYNNPIELIVTFNDIVQTFLSTSVSSLVDGNQKTQIVSSSGVVAMVEPRKQTPTGDALNVQIGPSDPIGNIPVVMEFEHHQVHEGETHCAEYYTASVNTIQFAVVVPASVYPHMVIAASIIGGGGLIQVYEGSTYTGGAELVSKNRNRNSLTVPGTKVYSGITSSDGTLLPDSQLFSAAEKVGSSSRAATEYVLKTGTTYRVDFTELTAASNLLIHFNWYEDLGV